MRPVFVHGAGMTRFGKLVSPLCDLFLEAAADAILDSGFEEFDALFTGAMNPEEFSGEGNLASIIADNLGIVPAPAFRIETASATGAALFQVAAMAVGSGLYDNVILIAGEKMTGVDTARATQILAEVIATNERKTGASMPALAGMVTRYYMAQSGMTLEDLAQVAVKNHHNAARNPYAHFQKPIDLQTVMASKIVASPLRIYDCGPLSDGAVAMVLSCHPAEVRLMGMGHGTDYLALAHRQSLTSFNATVSAAKKAYKMAGIEPRDIHFAEIHDAFTPFEIIGTEDCGFFAPLTGWRHLKDGDTALTGRIPINSSGGLKARGHPVGASGLAQITEIYWQLRQRARNRQVEGRVGLAQSIGGFATNNFVTILERV